MTLRYKIAPTDSVRYQFAVVRGTPEYYRQRYYYRFSRAMWLSLWIYGFAITILYAHSLIAELALLVFLALQLRQFLPFDTHLKRLFLERYGTSPTKELELRIDNGGITEAEGEVVFYAPWSGIHTAFIESDLLLIRAISGQYVVVPRHSLEPSAVTLETLLEDISSRIERAKRTARIAAH